MHGKFRIHLIAILVIIFCFCVNAGAEELDPISAPHFEITKDTIIVPTEKLRPSEKVTPEEISNSVKAPIHKPLDVIERGDGTYTIIEGSKTFTALKESGAKNFPVIIHPLPYQKNVKTIEDLYALNLAAEDEFNNLMKDLQAELGGEIARRPGIKKEARVREKARLELSGDYSAITDMWAASLIYPDEQSLLAALEKIKNRDDVIWINDRWHNPLPQGYRDIQLSIILSNGAIVELQFHHKTSVNVDFELSHYTYEFLRSNINNPEMKSYTDRAVRLQRRLYESIWDGRFAKIDAETMKLLEDTLKQLATQKSPDGAKIILDRMEEILINALGEEEEYEAAA